MWRSKEKQLNHVQIKCETIKRRLSPFKSKFSSSDWSGAGMLRRTGFKEKLQNFFKFPVEEREREKKNDSVESNWLHDNRIKIETFWE